MRDAAGELQNVQRIAPEKPTPAQVKAGKAEKRYLPGGRKSGLWHLIGQLEGALVLLLAEGYATGATLHEATGRPVAVAFDASNPEAARNHLHQVDDEIARLVDVSASWS